MRVRSVERQSDTLYSWRGRPLARHGHDLYLHDGRWWGRILPMASSIFDERGVYLLADLLDTGRIATDPWKLGLPANMFRGGWDVIDRPRGMASLTIRRYAKADLGAAARLVREPLFPPKRG